MMPKSQKILKYIICAVAIAMIILLGLYLACGFEWAKKPFYITLATVCIYNLFNMPKAK